MNDSLERHDLLDRHLVELNDAYALRAMSAVGDEVRLNSLTDQYLRDAMVLLGALYGAACGRQVRQSARRARPAASGRGVRHPAHQRLLQLAGNGLRTYTLQWHLQLMEMGGPRRRPA